MTTPNPTLFSYSEQFASLLAGIEAGDIPEEAIADTLEALEEGFHSKAVSVAAYIKGLEAEADAMRAHLDNVKRRMEAIENRAERLRNYLKECMERAEQTEIQDARFSIKVKQCPAKVVIPDESKVPGMYCDWHTIRKIDKAQISRVLKEQGNTDWAHLEKSTRLEIK